jgi:GGDEF domain-containing protein
MRVFDRVDRQTLDRREWQLWVLAMVTILILTAGMALVMYPAVFSAAVTLGGGFMRRSFIGFVVLCFLLEVYLLDRQLVIRRLRRQLAEEQQLKAKILEQASADLLESLPGFSHFQDRLAMEFRRATNTQQPLSLLLVSLTPMRELLAAGGGGAILGDAAKVLIRRLRREDSMYLFRPFVFGVVLPGLSGEIANRVAERLNEGLTDASGAGNRFTAELQMVNYPEHTTSARELEQIAVRCFKEAVPETSAA